MWKNITRGNLLYDIPIVRVPAVVSDISYSLLYETLASFLVISLSWNFLIASTSGHMVAAFASWNARSRLLQEVQHTCDRPNLQHLGITSHILWMLATPASVGYWCNLVDSNSVLIWFSKCIIILKNLKTYCDFWGWIVEMCPSCGICPLWGDFSHGRFLPWCPVSYSYSIFSW